MELSTYWYFVLPVSIIGLLCIIGNIRPATLPERIVWRFLMWQPVVLLVTFLVMGMVNTAYLLSFTLYFIFFYVCIKIRLTNIEICKILNSYMLSGIIVGALLVTIPTSYGHGEIRFTLQLFSDHLIDPNYLGAFMVFPYIIALAKLFFVSSLRTILYYLACAIILVVGIFLTGSRSALIASFIGMFFIIFQFLKGGLNLKIIALCSFFLLIVTVLLSSFIPENTYARLFMESYNDGSNASRVLYWKSGLDAFCQHPIFGYGYTSEMDAIKKVVRKEYIAHNTFIAILIHFGILGFSLYFHGVYKLLTRILRYKEYILFGSLIATLQLAFVVSAQVSIFFWFPIILIVCIVNDMKYSNQRTLINYL